MAKTHGMSHTPIYRTWCAMLQRCNNTNNPAYARYGGRGISVCQEWQDFEKFHADMGDCPEGMSLDRIDNDGDYCRENCRWATYRQQSNNTRGNVLIEYQGKELSLAQWARELGVSRNALAVRYRRGWPVSDILTIPIKPRKS